MPLWSGVIRSKYCGKTRRVNNHVENWFGHLKCDLLKNKRVAVSELAMKLYTRVKSKYYEFYETNKRNEHKKTQTDRENWKKNDKKR